MALRLGDAGGDRLVVPALPLAHRIGIEVRDVETRALVFAAATGDVAHRSPDYDLRVHAGGYDARDPRPGSHRMGNPLLAIHALGQSIWLDNISRELLDTGKLAQLIAEDGISGVTSNPTIFEKAIGHSELYDRTLSAAAHDGLDARAIFFKLAYADIREGADLLRPAYDAADGQDGHISFELPPELAHDAAGSIEAAKRIKAEIDRAERVHQGAGDARGRRGVPRAHGGGRLGQRDAAVRGRALRGDRERLDRRSRAARRGRRAGRPARLGRELLRLARGQQGRRAPRAARPQRAAGHRGGRERQARLPLVPAASSRARAGRRSRPRARTCSARCGPRRRRRTRPTPTRSTSTR